MSSQPPRGRGRARGRAESKSASQATGPPPPVQTSRPGPPPKETVQHRRPGGSGGAEVASYARATHRSLQKTDTKEMVRKMASVSLASGDSGSNNGGNGNGNGNGNGDGQPVGRGGLRGRRQLPPTDILRTRPEGCQSKKGVSGTHVQVQANYFKLNTAMNWTLYQYRVDFKAEEDRSCVKKAWLRECQGALGTSAYIFDGTVMFTAQRLSAGNEPIQVTTKKKETGEVVLIELRLVGDVQVGDMVYIQVFNLLMRRCLGHLNLQLVGRNFFDARAKVTIPEHKLELWPGYITSIRQHEESVLMCAEITHKVMRTDTVIVLLQECYHRDRQEYKRLFTQAIVGQVVLTDYNNKMYRIDDVDFTKTPSTKFKLRDDSEISFVDYYMTRYQIQVRDVKQPLLVSKASARDRRAGMSEYCNLIPELCRMTGITDEMRNDFKVMSAMAEHTRVGPANRVKKLCNFNDRLNKESKIVAEFKQWGMALDRNLVNVPARILPPELIIVGNDKRYPVGSSFDWTRELRDSPMLLAKQISELVVICPNRLIRDGQNFLRALQKAGSSMDFHLPQPRVLEVPDDKTQTLVQAIERCGANSNPDMMMFFVTNNRSDRYSAIKRKCCVDRGVLSQVILAKNLNSKNTMSIATKVAIQMNAKLGGAPWTTEIPLQGLMVVGYDACHDTTSKTKSYGAMVASLNKSLSSWFSAVSPHVNGEELSNTFSLDICKAIRKYRDINGSLPARIVIYRDGVGEGQLHHVFHHEVVLIKERLTEFYGGASWKMGYIVVTKRINTRLFANKGSNPTPGTIVDSVITLPQKYDFFLVSQTVRQGTVAPTSYNVISDNLGLDADKIQRLTYKMTHLYYNWSGTVRVPAPCQYAHKLAFLVGQSLHTEPNPVLETKLYFL